MSGHRTTSALAVAGVLVAALLAGCADPETGSADTSPEPTASASPAPTPTATEAAPPTLDQVVLSTGGLGPLRVGEPVTGTGEQSAIVTWDPVRCVDSGFTEGQPYAGSWVPLAPEAPHVFGGEFAPFHVLTDVAVRDTPVLEIRVYSPEVVTASGVGVLSTRAELLAAEPTAQLVGSSGISDLYTVEGPDGRMTFEVAVDTGDGYWEPQLIERVLLAWALDRSREPFFGLGGDTAGVCPV